MADKIDITVLVIDDETANVESLERIFDREGMRVLTATSGQKALDLCRNHRVHVALTDLMMPGMDGISVIKALATVSPDTEVVVMTAYGTVETAVSAMREGAYDFVEKPLKRVQIVKTIRKAAERQALVSENRDLKRELTQLKHKSIVGSSAILRKSLAVASQAAPSSANVLVLGESGTGKELLARHVHEHSNRKGEFVAVNLAALPESIVESEIFGHEKGAFTGAAAKREGRIAQARNGTLFLDEIGELSPHVQVKLLRVLQEGEYEPLGGRTEKADFRLIAATNRDLAKEVAEGRFREDLFYRLNVIAITCPPLRERAEDVPLLVDHFVEVYCRKNNRETLRVSREVLDRLTGHSWPGNVRELENVIERAVVVCRGPVIQDRHLPRAVREAADDTQQLTLIEAVQRLERQMIEEALRTAAGNMTAAARALGATERVVRYKVRKLGIVSPRPRR